MNTALNPGGRPRRGIAAVLALALVAVVAVVAVVVGTPDEASASGLEPFASCADLQGWGADAQQFQATGAMEVASDGVAPPTTGAAAPTASGLAGEDVSTERTAAADETGGTNVVVRGVDELDTVDRVGGDRVLIAAAGNVSLVDLASGRVLDQWPARFGAQLTYDPDAAVAWTVGTSEDGTEVEVHRLAVGADSLTEQGAWSTPGFLVTARRVAERLHVVASDGFTGIDGGPKLPFDGAPVPCADVLHPAGRSDATATLLATLPVNGDLQPVHTAEVVGSGQLVHVTADAAYLATPLLDGDDAATTIHRFDLAELTHTGSGRVAGTLLNDFSMSEHDDHLRVAITKGGPTVGRPIPVTDGPLMVDDVGAGDATSGSPGTGDTPVAAPPETVVPETTVPPEPEPTIPGTPGPEPTVVPAPAPAPVPTTPSTTVVPTTWTSTTEPELTAPPATTTPPGADDPRNQVVVLDIDGDLDQVGATPWFGHPGETLHGIRFDGATAYAVTFLTTDPFYVLDLADPAAPRVAGEVELPGFSSYLHPIAPGKVVGFGPDAEGRASAKLFDVSDPRAPKVVDTLALGDESPVAYDHHAFVDLGDGRFAVPTSTWGTVPPCGGGPAVDVVCPDVVTSATTSTVLEVQVDGNELRVVERTEADLPQPASRAIPAGDGWALLADPQLVVLDGSGTPTTVELG